MSSRRPTATTGTRRRLRVRSSATSVASTRDQAARSVAEAAPPAAPVTDPAVQTERGRLPDRGGARGRARTTGRDDLQRMLDERTADLQRVQAEFTNYRRRVERDRQAVAEQALASVLVGLLPVLDDIDRAREPRRARGGFKLVADGLETTLGQARAAALRRRPVSRSTRRCTRR